MGRLIILARYWNDIDFLQASLNQVDYWDADLVYLSEGAWDQNFEPRSTDGTRENLEEYSKGRDNVFVIDNVRESKNYRVNQANTSNLVMRLADWQPDDWMMIVDADHFYTMSDIDFVKRRMNEEVGQFDYFTYKVNNFFYDLRRCQETFDSSQSRLPSRLVEGSYWVATNHLTLNGIIYDKTNQMRPKVLSNIQALHYEGLRPQKRLSLRYSVGNRKTFWEYKGGIRLKNNTTFSGKHSEFVSDVLKRCCIFPEGSIEYVKLHCNMDIFQYHDPPEIKVVKKYFENFSPENVIELGCGLGRSTVGFYKAFPSWKNTQFYLLDGNSGKKQICQTHYKSSDSFYNDLKLTKEFCLANGILSERIHILNAEKPNPFLFIGDVKFDFVYSFLSIGFHWPISLYLKKLLQYLHSGSILCFGIRPMTSEKYCKFNTYQIESVPKDKFDILEVTTKSSFDSILALRKK